MDKADVTIVQNLGRKYTGDPARGCTPHLEDRHLNAQDPEQGFKNALYLLYSENIWMSFRKSSSSEVDKRWRHEPVR